MIELEGNRRVLFQWEKDQRVVVDGFLPMTKVEFYHKSDGKDSALAVNAYEDAGRVVAEIPNVLLQTAGYLRVHVRPAADDALHAPEEKDIKIVRKERPEDYEYTETPTVSMANKADRYWGESNAGKTLVIGDDGFITAGEPEERVALNASDDGMGNVTLTTSGIAVRYDGTGNVSIG